MIVVEVVVSRDDTRSPDRQARLELRCERLARSLASESTSARVTDAAGRADVYLVTPPIEEHAYIDPTRAVILGCPRGTGFELTRTTGLAGAVDEINLDYWFDEDDDDMTPWVVARSDLLRGSGWSKSVVIEPDIVVGSHPNDDDLPSLIRRLAHELATREPMGDDAVASEPHE